jgi:serine/threonine-protein kinase
MGEVYRARDPQLKREVALKVLAETVAGDADRLARFRREAQVLASLNHPNIAAIYGFEQDALILEFVEGPTLADLIAAAPLPIPEALSIARQICEALHAAHDQGVVHRDLKPANIKVRPDGSVKVLDFGLAKAVETSPAAVVFADSPTITSPAMLTGVGFILGTAAYMSPEQARGKPVDRRSDVWSFGCVLYEMLTGRRAFDGDGVTDTLARVLQSEPDLAALPRETPSGVRKLLVRCLEKDQTRRLPHIAVASFQIQEALTGPSSDLGDNVVERRSMLRVRGLRPLFYGAALIASAALGAAAIWMFSSSRTAVAPLVTRLQMNVSPADQFGGNDGRPIRQAFALSPDGRTLVFSAVQKNARALYIRRLDRVSAELIPGTDGAMHPFFSPDGSWIGYWAAGQIRKVPLAGGPSVLVTAVPPIFGASWGNDGRIVFARGAGGLLEVPADGGKPTEVTTLSSDRKEVSHRLPHALPGGDAVLFTVTHDRFPRWDETQVWLYSRRSGASKLLIEGGADARYVTSGHLLYAREGALLAVPFDPDRLEITGGAVGVVPDVMQAAYVTGQNGDTGAMQVSVSSTGTLVYIAGGVHVPATYTVVSVDRMGREEQLPIDPGEFRTVRRSPDGTRLALSTAGRERGVWLYDFARGTFARLTAADRSAVPVWTPDGERITYAAAANGPDGLYWIRSDGGGPPELLFTNPRNLVPGGWTPDGRQLLYYTIPGDAPTPAQQEIAILAQGRGEQNPVNVGSESGMRGGGGVDVSPDGRWVAYQSRESGDFQVYVDAFPGPGPRFQISTKGGGSPVWSADGRELFYVEPLAADSGQPQPGSQGVRVMAVAVTMKPALSFGIPRPLFSGRYSMNAPGRGYDVTRDGQRFLLLKERERAPDVISEMTVVQNWIAELK